jgi:hypothetical protein
MHKDYTTKTFFNDSSFEDYDDSRYGYIYTHIQKNILSRIAYSVYDDITQFLVYEINKYLDILTIDHNISEYDINVSPNKDITIRLKPYNTLDYTILTIKILK